MDLTNRNNQPKTPILRNISKSAHTSTATKKVMAKNLRKTKRERIMNISPIHLYPKSKNLSFQLKSNPSLAAQEETQAPFLAVAASCTTTTKSSSLSLRMTNLRLTSFWYFFHRSFWGRESVKIIANAKVSKVANNNNNQRYSILLTVIPFYEIDWHNHPKWITISSRQKSYHTDMTIDLSSSHYMYLGMCTWYIFLSIQRAQSH